MTRQPASSEQRLTPLAALPLQEGDARRPWLSLTPAEAQAWLAVRGAPAWQAQSIRRWIVQRRAESFAVMTDLPGPLRSALETEFRPLGTTEAVRQQASDGTCKLLVRLWDGESVECVLIPDRDRRTACISTQVGCGMGCVFCASGIGGVTRNLEVGEILEQLLRLRNTLPASERLTHVVVMGMGEPLANLDALMAALGEACAPAGLGIGARHVTISTVGLPAKIRRLAEVGRAHHLAVSLHAPNDDLRRQIVPTSVGLTEILAAADDFFARTGRQVTFEYVLLREVNDRPEQARELAALLAPRPALVNLIPFNEVAGLPYRRPTDEALAAFVEILRAAGLSVKVRKRKGAEIDAACGQLRRRAAEPAPVGT
ncbi:MAG TPA: 23S rRNA (adenine(2503)-C(2))-methyltransferase RlmN [Gemmatales bacterium]|nr:23S rRNA (adenine(2503)-C(2))-methyltransferase RlmN [Gemmatales bacterium]HMP59324.1 23S rRNA (adenine(2503)-C(2))-methyltransferase RlmN [Gemmatales bacterium]